MLFSQLPGILSHFTSSTCPQNVHRLSAPCHLKSHHPLMTPPFQTSPPSLHHAGRRRTTPLPRVFSLEMHPHLRADLLKYAPVRVTSGTFTGPTQTQSPEIALRVHSDLKLCIVCQHYIASGAISPLMTSPPLYKPPSLHHTGRGHAATSSPTLQW